MYNVEKYLPECIDSILNQTFLDTEILLIDDGSYDNSGAICDDYALKDDRIKVFHTKNGGVSRARNLGIKESKGDLIAFVDGDDYIEPTMFEKLHAALGNNQIVFCRFVNEYADKTVYRFEKNLEFAKKTPYDFLLYTDESDSCYDGNTYICSRIFGSVCRQLFFKKIIIDNNINFESDLKIAEDRLFLLEYLCFCKTAAVVDEYLYHYRMTNINSATSTAFECFQPELAIRNKLLTKRQLVLVDDNSFMSQKRRKIFKARVSNNCCYEIVQNELLYDVNYSVALNTIFNDSFFRKMLGVRSIIMNFGFFGIKKTIFMLLVKFHIWNLLHWIVNKGD